MSESISGEGTKIAQAAKDLNVTSVTIRRYLSEFDIKTTADENGVKVLPPTSIHELLQVRKLKEEGAGNNQVLEALERGRGKTSTSGDKSPKVARSEDPVLAAGVPYDTVSESIEESVLPAAQDPTASSYASQGQPLKHTLTCQTCGKSFEHLNPRLRDCLDCYRAKRKERRRGGGHKTVIQHPLAKLAADKSREQTPFDPTEETAVAHSSSVQPPAAFAPPMRQTAVRNYRRAIDETRHVTGNLKRRLERPDLPEGERRWLEQMYAYQLILHQGWRHLAEYRSAGQPLPQQPIKAEQTESVL